MKDDFPHLYVTTKLATTVTDYSNSKSRGLPSDLLQFHAEIKKTEKSNYTISEFEAKYISWFANLIGAKRVLEIGVYLGFSMSVWAKAVGPDGHVTGLEFNPEFAAQAQKNAKGLGLNNTDVVVGDGVETLQALDSNEPFDVIFIDANKTAYPEYLRIILERSQPGASKRLLRKGGVIIGDNVLRYGLAADHSSANPNHQLFLDTVIDPSPADYQALSTFNEHMMSNPRLDPMLVPLFDGLGHARLLD